MTFTRWMALDVGTKKIGVAISDPLKLTARPLTTFVRSELLEDTDRILALAREYSVDRIVVGRPMYLDGRDAPVMETVRRLYEALTRDGEIALVWSDERLSSKEAESLMAEIGVDVKQRRKKRDEFAAALILKWYCDEQSHG